MCFHVCVTPPVEVSPKEARHTSMQTRALWNGVIISLSRKRLYTQFKFEHKQWTYILSLFLWHVFPCMCDTAGPSRFPRKRLVTFPCRHVPSGMASSFPCPVSDYTHNFGSREVSCNVIADGTLNGLLRYRNLQRSWEIQKQKKGLWIHFLVVISLQKKHYVHTTYVRTSTNLVMKE